MKRNHSTSAIVLRTNPIGELHKGVVMLTPDLGLVRAIAHGARSPRGKLRGSTDPFVFAHCFLYNDPVKNSSKITDMNVFDFFSGIREGLARFYTASLFAEVILKSHAGGAEPEPVFSLLLESLQLLDNIDEARADRILVQFLWRFLRIGGTQPDISSCARSGEYLAEGDPIYYSTRDHGFCSPSYATDDMIGWQPGAAAYVRHTSTLPLGEVTGIQPPEGALMRIKRVLYRIVEDLVEEPLNSLRTGGGII